MAVRHPDGSIREHSLPTTLGRRARDSPRRGPSPWAGNQRLPEGRMLGSPSSAREATRSEDLHQYRASAVQWILRGCQSSPPGVMQAVPSRDPATSCSTKSSPQREAGSCPVWGTNTINLGGACGQRGMVPFNSYSWSMGPAEAQAGPPKNF